MSQYDFDPAFRDLLPVLPTTQPLDSVEKIREARSSRIMMFPAPPDREDVVKQDHRIAGPKGAPDVTVRVYRPKAPASGPRPGVFEIHGGGFMMGDIAMMDPWCQRVAAEIDAVVVSVEYRLAPEHPFPAAVEDCTAATDYISSNHKALKIDPARIAVGGDSAGGNLATVVALHARDAGGPALAFQLLIYPATDQRGDFPSYRSNGKGYLLTSEGIEFFSRCYLPDRKALADWRASPLLAPSLARLPPAFVLTAGYDPLLDEGRAYAERLSREGVAVQYREYPDMVHGFLLFGGVLDTANAAVAECCAALARVFEKVTA